MADETVPKSKQRARTVLKFLKWVAALIVALGAIAAATLKAINTIHAAADKSAARVANQQAIVGEIRAFAVEEVPDGWLECDGSPLDRDKYSDLYTAIKTSWGSSDQNHFNIPDFRGQFLRGWNHDREKPSGQEGKYWGDIDADARIAAKHAGNKGDHVGSAQPDELKEHFHEAVANKMGEQSAQQSWEHWDGMRDIHATGGSQNGKAQTSTVGGRETRPINSYVMFCIYAGPQAVHKSR